MHQNQPETAKTAPSSPNRHLRAQSVSSNPLNPAFGIPGFNPLAYRTSAIAAQAASATNVNASTNDAHQRLLSLFQQMYTAVDTLAANWKKDGGIIEGNDDQTLENLNSIAKLLKSTIVTEASVLNLERYVYYVMRFRTIQTNAKKSKGWLFSTEYVSTALGSRLDQIVTTFENNKTRYEDAERQATERAHQDALRSADDEKSQKLVADLEARRKEDEERSRKFAAEIEAQRKVFEEELKRRSEQEEARRREDQQRQEAAFRALQESLEAQRKEAHEAQRRAEREFERRMEQTVRDLKEKDQTIHELRRDLKKAEEKDETIRELRQKIAGYESQRSQAPAPKTPAAQTSAPQIPTLAPSNATLDKYLGKRHAELFKDLCKLRNFAKLKAIVEPMIKSLFFEFQKPIEEGFFIQLFDVKLDVNSEDDKSSLEALTNFKTSHQKYIDSGDGDQNVHKLHLKTLYAQVQTTITKSKLPEGTTVESYIYSRLGEEMDNILSSPIVGLSKLELKTKAQSLRDKEVERHTNESSKITTPNASNGH